MSTVKTKISPEEVVTFLRKNVYSSISTVEFLKGGELSQACAFSTHKGDFVIRINKDKYTYEKDKYAFASFAGAGIPVPEVLEIGKFNEQLFYAISKKAVGKTFDVMNKETAIKLLSQLINTLNEIHSIKLDDGKYGYWDSFGKAEIVSWKEFILHRDDKFVNAHPDDDFIKKLHQSVRDLGEYLPEDRYLVHGDFGFNNLVADGETITGVLDWGEPVYGDFMYDVAWLTFWPSEVPFVDIFKEHYKKNNKKVKNFEERLRCYLLQIGLGSLGFFAKSEQEDDYNWTKDKLLGMINRTP